MKFKSKIDPVRHLSIWAPLAAALALYGILPFFPQYAGIFTLFGTLLIVAFMLMIPKYFGTNYSFTKNCLSLKCGFSRLDIGYGDILSVRRVKSWSRSGALSKDRLLIEYKNSGKACTTMISPEDRTGFLKELERRTDAGIVVPMS